MSCPAVAGKLAWRDEEAWCDGEWERADVASEDRMQAIYDAHSNALFRTLLTWLAGDWQAAEDVLQETMVRAWRNIEALNPDPGVLRPWLLTVARRLTIDRFRSRAARPTEVGVEELEPLGVPVDPYECLLDRRVLFSVLNDLSAAHREALIHVYLLDRTVPEAAAVLGVPEGTVKSRLHHALRALRDMFEDSADWADWFAPAEPALVAA